MRPKSVTTRAALACWLAAAIALVALLIAGNARAGVAVALGLVLGSVNGLLAERSFSAGMSMRWSSLPRLALLSGIAIGGGLLLGANYAWLLILGVGAAQLVLVGVAARSVLRR